MTNKYRGEVALKLGDREYKLRPSFHAICSIESEIDRSLIDIISGLSKRNLTIDEVSIIIFHGIKSCEKHSFDKPSIGKLVFEEGIINILPAIVKFLEFAVGIGGKDE